MIVNEIYTRVVSVLGKDQDDPEFIQFMKDLGEMPEVVDLPSQTTEYVFSRTGVSLQYMEKAKCFVSAFFHWASTSVLSGRIKQFEGELAGGIQFGDNREQVERKLKSKPSSFRVATGELHEEYVFGPIEMHFKYGTEQTLEHLSVWFIPACFWRKS